MTIIIKITTSFLLIPSQKYSNRIRPNYLSLSLFSVSVEAMVLPYPLLSLACLIACFQLSLLFSILATSLLHVFLGHPCFFYFQLPFERYRMTEEVVSMQFCDHNFTNKLYTNEEVVIDLF